MLLYHGSGGVVPRIDWNRCRDRNDYGKAFYLCPEFNRAAEWAVIYHYDEEKKEIPTVNKYEFNPGNIPYFDFMDGTHTVLEWLATLLFYRTLRLNDIEQYRANLLIENYAQNLNPNDYAYIVGYRADDGYFRIATSFLDGLYDIQSLKRAMAAGHLLDQWAIKNDKGAEALTLIDAYVLTPEERQLYWQSARNITNDATRLVESLSGGKGYFILDIVRALENNDWDQLSKIESSAHIERKY